MLAANEAFQRLLDDRRRDLPFDTVEADDLGAASEHFRAIAFIDGGMRFGMGEDGAIGRCQRRKG